MSGDQEDVVDPAALLHCQLQWQSTAQEALAQIYPTDLWTKLMLVLAVWAGMHNDSTVLMPVLESETSIQLTSAQQHRAAHCISSLTKGQRHCFRQEQKPAMECGSFPTSGLDSKIAQNPRRPACFGDVFWNGGKNLPVTGGQAAEHLICLDSSVTGQIGASYPAKAVPLCQGTVAVLTL